MSTGLEGTWTVLFLLSFLQKIIGPPYNSGTPRNLTPCVGKVREWLWVLEKKHRWMLRKAKDVGRKPFNWKVHGSEDVKQEVWVGEICPVMDRNMLVGEMLAQGSA